MRPWRSRAWHWLTRSRRPRPDAPRSSSRSTATATSAPIGPSQSDDDVCPKMSSQEVAAYVAVAVAAAGAIVHMLRGRRGKTYPVDDKYP